VRNVVIDKIFLWMKDSVRRWLMAETVTRQAEVAREKDSSDEIPAWHLEALDIIRAKDLENPADGRPWEEVREQIRNELSISRED
jgi:hypothetical protein